MPLKTLATALTAAFVATTAQADGTIPRIEGTKSPYESPAIAALLPSLDAWITAYSDYPETDRPLSAIALVEPGFSLERDGKAMQLGGTLRGLYDPESATIYLVRPWFGDDPYDQSVLLHELVHHRQVDAKHWYCGQAMEWDAYKLQEEFLAAHDIDPGFHWASILLESSCAPRDHHPE